MKASDFIERVDYVLDTLKDYYHKDAFVKNMEKLPQTISSKKFSEWMMMYLAWSELGSADDVASYFWYLEYEKDEDTTEE